MATPSQKNLVNNVLTEATVYGLPPEIAGQITESICGPQVGELAAHLSRGGTIKGFVQQLADSDPKLAAYCAVRRVSREDLRTGKVDPADILAGKVRCGR